LWSYEARDHYRGDVAANYVRARVGDPRWRREQETMRRALDALPGGRRILDVPFGTGRFAEYYAAGRHSVVGVDISRDMMVESGQGELVRALAPSLVQADAERLPLRDRAVDYVVCARLFNWIPRSVATRMLGEFRRVARDGILLQIRVGTRRTAPGFARDVVATVAREPKQVAVRAARAAARRGQAALRALSDQGRREPATYPGGYTVPTDAELDTMLRANGLAVAAMVPVHSSYDFRHLVSKELRLYRLQAV
jgi:ubiquinone/menaquinone biosynthesis C-methylase UbiE